MGRITDKPQSVNDAKNQLRKVTTEINYLSPIINPIKARPIKSATTAFMAGVALNRLAKNGLPPSLLSLMIAAMKRL